MSEVDQLFRDGRERRSFEFNGQVAQVFDDMVSRSVPFYSVIQDAEMQLAATFAQPGSRIVDLGCSTGTTLAKAGRIAELQDCQLVGVDNSEPMLEKAHEKLKSVGLADRSELICADLLDEFDISNASVVFLNWTLQFVRPLKRDHLIRRIYNSLNEGGVLIMAEKVLAEDSMINGLYIDYYYDYKREQSYTNEEIARKREALENVLIPYHVDENMELLRRAGFPTVDIFFKWFNWAGFIAVKR